MYFYTLPALQEVVRKGRLIEFLDSKIAEEEIIAEDLIQECDNPEEADNHFAKADAFKEVLKFLTTI